MGRRDGAHHACDLLVVALDLPTPHRVGQVLKPDQGPSGNVVGTGMHLSDFGRDLKSLLFPGADHFEHPAETRLWSD